MTNKITTKSIVTVASILVSGIFATVGCTSSEGETVGRIVDKQIFLNGFYFQSFSMNPTDENGLSVGSGSAIYEVPLDGLRINARSGKALKVNGRDFDLEQEAQVDRFFSYLSHCALSATQSISVTMSDGAVNTYTGEFGLGAEWANDVLSDISRPKVTACLAALTNSDEQHVKVSLRSDVIDTHATEQAVFSMIEGAFWGNAFGDKSYLYTCSADISGIAGRSCTEADNDCGFRNVGLCSEICTQDAADGHYTDCLGNTDVITVMLPYTDKSSFTGAHSCATNNSGIMACWGQNTVGQVGGKSQYSLLPQAITLNSTEPVVEVAGGANHSCARQATGKVSCWGDNTRGQLGLGISAANFGEPSQIVPLVDDAMSLVSGANHVCTLNADSTVLCWGENDRGQLGDSTNADSDVPVVTLTNNAFIRLASSVTSNHTCAVEEGGQVYCWGDNTSGQLGDRTAIDRPVPVRAKASEAVDVCTGTSYTCVLGTNGKGTCFGSLSVSTTNTASRMDCSANSVCFSGANGTECF